MNWNFRKTRFYRITLWLALILCAIAIWVLGARIFLTPGSVMYQDYAQIWAAGRLNLSGQNPYDPSLIHELKDQIAGQQSMRPAVTSIFYSPPWSLLLAMPVGLLPYLPGRLLWLILNIAVLFICVRLLWSVYGDGERRRWISWLAVFTLGPTFLVLSQGQTTPLVLLGIAGFLYSIERRQNDWLAGSCAALLSIKPQLFYLFWFALLFWVIVRRRWKVLTGLLLAILGATLASLVFNHQLAFQYIEALSFYPPFVWSTPTLGMILRLFFGLEKFWLQYIPSLFGIAWFLWYWRRRREDWVWSKEIPVLIFVSLFTTPFGWTYDQILIIVALIPAWIALFNDWPRPHAVWLLALYIFINLLYLIMHRHLTDEYFIWYLPMLFFWWWIVQKTTGKMWKNSSYFLKNS